MCHLLSWNNCDHFCSGCIPHSHLKLTLCHKNSQHWHICVHCHVWLFKIHVNYFKLSHATKFSTNILFIPKLHSLCCCKKTLSLTCNITLHSEVTDIKFLKQIDIWHTLPLLLDKLPKSTEKKPTSCIILKTQWCHVVIIYYKCHISYLHATLFT